MDEVATFPIGEFDGVRLQMYSIEAVWTNSDGRTARLDKHRPKMILRAEAESLLHPQYLDQLHNTRQN